MNCPRCDNEAPLKNGETKLTLGGHEVIVSSIFYKCATCETEFTTTELDTVNLCIADLTRQLEEKEEFWKSRYDGLHHDHSLLLGEISSLRSQLAEAKEENERMEDPIVQAIQRDAEVARLQSELKEAKEEIKNWNP